MSTKRKSVRRPPARPAPPRPARRLPLVVIAVLGVIVVLAVVAVLATRGDGDDEAEQGDTGDRSTLSFAPVSIEGTALPDLPDEGPDPAVGTPAPILHGTTPDSRGGIVGPDPGGRAPTLVAVVAHWCPHCNAEVPRLVDLFESGDLPAGTRFIALATDSRRDAPNFPPGPWLEELAWPGEVVLDDEERLGAHSLGTRSYPFLIVLDGSGRVVGRVAGEATTETVASLLQEAAAATAGG
ncbi:MAG: TlpA family protein disulfide reductase [Acidimicrobiales bacterium]